MFFSSLRAGTKIDTRGFWAPGKVGVDGVGADFLKKPVAVQLLFEHHEVRCSIEKFSADKIDEKTVPPAYVIRDDQQWVAFGNGWVTIYPE